MKTLKIFSRTTVPPSTKLGTNHSWVKGIQVCSNERLHPSQRGDNSERVKINWTTFKNFLLQNHWANFNKTWHKASMGEDESSFYSNEESNPSQRGDNCKKVKIHYWKLFKVFFSRTTGTFSTKLDTKRRIQFCNMKVQPILKGEIITK